MSEYRFKDLGSSVLSRGAINSASDPANSQHPEFVPMMLLSMQTWRNYDNPSLSPLDAVNANHRLLKKMNAQLEKYGPESFIPKGANAKEYVDEVVKKYNQRPESRGEFSNKALAGRFYYKSASVIQDMNDSALAMDVGDLGGPELLERASMALILADLNLRTNAKQVTDDDRVAILEVLRESLMKGIERGLPAHPNMTLEALAEVTRAAARQYRDQLAADGVTKGDKTTANLREIHDVFAPMTFEHNLGERVELAYKKDALEFALKSQNMTGKERLRVYENYRDYWIEIAKTMKDEDILRGVSTDDLEKYVDDLESRLERLEQKASSKQDSSQVHAVHGR